MLYAWSMLKNLKEDEANILLNDELYFVSASNDF